TREINPSLHRLGIPVVGLAAAMNQRPVTKSFCCEIGGSDASPPTTVTMIVTLTAIEQIPARSVTYVDVILQSIDRQGEFVRNGV
ncbi:hypothetical protein M8C21_009647, partial [Ambrosia artemisiifolia]